VSDIAERLLDAITAEEAAADERARSKYVRQRPGGTYKAFRPRDEERYQAILRRCAADREEVEDCVEILSDSARQHPELLAFVDRTLARLARGYGLEET